MQSPRANITAILLESIQKRLTEGQQVEFNLYTRIDSKALIETAEQRGAEFYVVIRIMPRMS